MNVGNSQSSAQFVWSDSHGTGRNVFCLFRRSFDLKTVPELAWLHLFADNQYRLQVNGELAAPGRCGFISLARSTIRWMWPAG